MKQKQTLQTALSCVMLPVNIWVLPWYPTCYVHTHRPQFSSGEGKLWEVGKLLHTKKALISLLSTNPMPLMSASGFKISAKMIVLKTSCLRSGLIVWEFKFWPFWCRQLGYGTWCKTMLPITATVCIFGEFVHSCFALEWLYPLFTGFVIVNCEEKLWWELALTTDHEQDTT